MTENRRVKVLLRYLKLLSDEFWNEQEYKYFFGKYLHGELVLEELIEAIKRYPF